jgi:hypothetical protein
MSGRGAEDRLHLAFSLATSAALGAAFWGSAWHGGELPAPLDDVYIHYDFARSAAQGHPFEWIAGQGYSSGETAPLYAAVLAIGYFVGFRGVWLGAWSAAVAVVSVASAMRSARALALPAPRWAAWLASAIPVSAALVDWSLFSGMEVALFAGLAGAALVATRRACEAPAHTRPRAQVVLGALGALLVMTRPESAVLVAPLAVLVARHARAQSALAALARVGGPGALVTGGFAWLNHALTGSAQAAGAQLKLLSSNPFLSDEDRARELALNLVHLKWQALDAGPASWPRAWPVVVALAAGALLARRTRGLAAAILAAALAWTLLVSFNGAARYQNYRYYAPGLLLLLFAAALGVAAAARSRARALGGALGVAALVLAAPRFPAQLAYFARASRNIHEQQVAVGRKLARSTPADAIILVGDAGAIPYFSERHAIDALGLGGFRRRPFTAAAPHGEAAVAEVLERLAPGERPTHLALYPNWFPSLTSRFGHEIDRVTIADNVICGGPTKGIYLPDWSSLADAPSADEIDVADVESERAHDYESPAPDGGWTVLEVRKLADGARRFDAGRVIPEGRRESFAIAPRATAAALLRVRLVADADAEIEAEVSRAGAVLERVRLERKQVPADTWEEARAALARPLTGGERVALVARKKGHQTFHVWLGPAELPRAGTP